MSNTALELAQQLVAVLSGGAVVPDRVPEKNTGQRPVYVDHVAVEDYWVEDQFGLLAGVRDDVYSVYQTIMSTQISGHGVPFHMSVCVPQPTFRAECMSTAADVGFMNRDDWVWKPGDSTNYARWIRCGCPHWTSDGRKWAGGEPSNDAQWEEHYRRLKELGRA